MSAETIFRPLRFRNLEVGNRIFRSNVAGRFDHYDGTGTQTRINWELKFARGGVGAILSSWTAVDERGKIVPSFAGIERENRPCQIAVNFRFCHLICIKSLGLRRLNTACIIRFDSQIVRLSRL